MIKKAAFFTRMYGKDAEPVITPIKWVGSWRHCYFFYLHDAKYPVESIQDFYKQRGYWYALKTTDTLDEKEYQRTMKWILQFESFLPYFVEIEKPLEIDGVDNNYTSHEFDFRFPDELDWYDFSPKL